MIEKETSPVEKQKTALTGLKLLDKLFVLPPVRKEMFTKIVTRALIAVFAVFLFSAIRVQGQQASNTGTALSQRAVAVRTTTAIASILQYPSLVSPEADKKKKKSVAAEPATWLYVFGAVLLIVVLERKALKGLFKSAPQS